MQVYYSNFHNFLFHIELFAVYGTHDLFINGNVLQTVERKIRSRMSDRLFEEGNVFLFNAIKMLSVNSYRNTEMKIFIFLSETLVAVLN